MKIAILGAGKMGGALARLWDPHFHAFFLTSTNADELGRLMNEMKSECRTGSNREAVAEADAVLLTVPWDALDDVIEEVGVGFHGRIVMDATNSVVFDPAGGGFRHLAPEGTPTARVNQDRMLQARLVKVFNTVPAPALEERLAGTREPFAVPFSGYDSPARNVVRNLVREAGMEPLDLGGLERADVQEFGGALWGETLPLEEARARLERADAEG